MVQGTWDYEKASDHLLGENPTIDPDRVPDLVQVPEGAVFLRLNQQRVEMWWRGNIAVLGHCDSDEKNLECAITERSLQQSAAISDSDLLEWTCSCCGVSLGQFTQDMHIRRDAAFAIFKHIITHISRPTTSIDGPVIWTEVEAD